MPSFSRLGVRGGGKSSTATLKKILLSLIVVGLLGTATYKRTYAALTAESVNSGNTLASATLTFSAQNQGEDPTTGVCTSNGAASANNNANVCSGGSSILFSGQTVPFLRYPATTTNGTGDTMGVVIKNTGSIPGASLEVALPTCTSAVTPGISSFLVAPEGTGNACGPGGLQIYIQETTSNTFATNATNGCLYSDAANVGPAPGVGTTTDCTTVWTGDSLSDLNSVGCWDLGPIAAQATRSFKIGIQFPSNASNTLQGTTATFRLAWHLYDSQHTSVCSND